MLPRAPCVLACINCNDNFEDAIVIDASSVDRGLISMDIEAAATFPMVVGQSQVSVGQRIDEGSTYDGRGLVGPLCHTRPM